ncbi:MAG: MATE family efflux transporter [Acidobacteriota bacterium]
MSKSSQSTFWKDLGEAVRGSQQDFTDGSISRAVAMLAVPMVLEMALESVFGILDMLWVGRLGADAVATVGLTEAMLTILFAIAMGLSMGTTATVARRIGEKNPEGAAVAAVQGIAAGIGISVLFGVIGFLYAPKLLGLMGATPGMIAVGSGYSTLMLGGSITIFLIFLINGVFRGAGDAAVAMRSLWIANAVNIALDPCLIFGLGPFPEMGVTGAAVGNVVGRGVGVCYQFWMLWRQRGRIVIHAKHLRLDFDVMVRLLRVSVGGTIQFLIATASWLGMVRIIAVFGGAALAGYTIAIRIIIFAILPSWGMSNAAATLVGQNLGAGKPERAEKSVWVAALCNMVFLGLVSVVFIVFARPLIGLFTNDAAVVSFGVASLRYISYGYVFYAYGMVMVQAFNGAGDTFTPTVINFGCYWLFQIPLAYWLALKMGLGADGVFVAIPIAESALAVVAILAFRRGTWKTQTI